MLHILPASDRFIVLGVILVIILAVRGFQFFSAQRKPKTSLPAGVARSYGMAGGAICPNCHRPFPLPIMAIKIGFGTKFTRCEFCGKWGLMRRASLDELRAAEAAELAETQAARLTFQKSDGDRLKDLVNDSRYTDRED